MPRAPRVLTDAQIAAIVREAMERHEARLRQEFAAALDAERANHRLELAALRAQLADHRWSVRGIIRRWLTGAPGNRKETRHDGY